MHIYLDESGCLGFAQRSTEYFTIAFIVVENPVFLRRCIKKIKIKHQIPRDVELKGARTRTDIKEDLLKELSKLDLEIHAITVKKANVFPKLRIDTDKLYNYMVGLSLGERVVQESKNASVILQVDRRITSVTSGFTLDNYLKYIIWYEKGRHDIDLDIHHLDSRQSYAIQGIDVVCNSVFRKYNSGNASLFNVIESKVKCDKRLFFDK